MIPTRQGGDILAGMWSLISGIGRVRHTLVWEREAAIGGSERLRHADVEMLLRAVLSSTDADLLANTLLSSVDVVLVDHLVREHGMSLEGIEAGRHDLVDRLLRRSSTVV